MNADLDGVMHHNKILAARLPLHTVGTGVSQKFMPYAVQTQVVETLVAMPGSSADKSKTPVYVPLKPNITSEGVEVGCLFVSEKEIFILPYQYSAVFLLGF